MLLGHNMDLNDANRVRHIGPVVVVGHWGIGTIALLGDHTIADTTMIVLWVVHR